MSELTMVHDADGVMAWNGEADVQMVATRMADGAWHIEAQVDGETEVDGMAEADAPLMAWVEAVYAEAMELLGE